MNAFILFTVTLVGGRILYQKITMQEQEAPKKSESRAQESKIEIRKVQPKASAHDATQKIPEQLSSESLRNSKLNTPSLKALRAEVSQDPHSTPVSLVNFAKSLAPMMTFVLNPEASENNVNEVALKMRECVLQESPASIRALCLVNLRRIKKVHPNAIAADLSQLRIPSRVVELARSLSQAME